MKENLEADVTRRRSRLRAVRVCSMLVLTAFVAATFGFRLRRSVSSPSPRFLNTLPDIRYVGSATCKDCHWGEAASFRQSPMGRSASDASSSIAGKSSSAHRITELPNPFDYRVGSTGEDLQMTETMFDAAGMEVYSQTERLAYVFGSGAHGQTFLIAREGGYLFEAPISWYRELNGWSMSPSYERADHLRFSRTITHECAFCHTGRSRPVHGTFNRFHSDQPFDELAISCERCHGPGQLHVEQQELGREFAGNTIVNPRRLPRDLSADICFQCHRTESEIITVMRPGREWTDFRPGTSVSAITQQFQAEGESDHPVTAGVHFSGKFTQLGASRCFTESGGHLQCLSCHSIHSRPGPDERVRYYRQACLSCHVDPGCSLPEPQRLAQQSDDSCYECHMPATAPVEIKHTTITDHRIRRPGEAPSVMAPPSDWPVRLIAVLPDRVDDNELKRNLAIANLHFARQQPTGGEHYVRRARVLFEGLDNKFQNDFATQLARGQCFQILGELDRAIPALQSALQLEPDNEYARLELSRAWELNDRDDMAKVEFAKIREIDPYHLYVLHALGRIEAQQGNLKHAEQLYRSILSISHGDAKALLGLGTLLLRQGNTEEGETLLTRYLQIHPDEELAIKALRR